MLSKTVVAAAIAAGLLFQPVSASAAPDAEGKCGALARGFWIDVFAKRDAEAARKYLADDYAQHSPPPQVGGKDWIPFWIGVFADPPNGPGKDLNEAQKDYKTVITRLVGDDNFAVLTAHDTGTYDHGPKKGQTFDIRYSDVFRCENGKIVEHWFSPDA